MRDTYHPVISSIDLTHVNEPVYNQDMNTKKNITRMLTQLIGLIAWLFTTIALVALITKVPLAYLFTTTAEQPLWVVIVIITTTSVVYNLATDKPTPGEPQQPFTLIDLFMHTGVYAVIMLVMLALTFPAVKLAGFIWNFF